MKCMTLDMCNSKSLFLLKLDLIDANEKVVYCSMHKVINKSFFIVFSVLIFVLHSNLVQEVT